MRLPFIHSTTIHKIWSKASECFYFCLPPLSFPSNLVFSSISAVWLFVFLSWSSASTCSDFLFSLISSDFPLLSSSVSLSSSSLLFSLLLLLLFLFFSSVFPFFFSSFNFCLFALCFSFRLCLFALFLAAFSSTVFLFSSILIWYSLSSSSWNDTIFY